MALKTHPQADTHAFLKWVQAAVSEAAGRPPRGAFFPFQTRYTLETTELDNADDRSRLLYFPAGIWLWDGSIYFEEEVDSHATPTLVWDLTLENAAGSADSRKLISASAKGAADGDVDRFDDAGLGVYAGEKYLVFNPTTAAATAVEADIVLSLVCSRGVPTNALPAISMDAI